MSRPSDSPSLLQTLERRLFAPVDISFLVWFRVLLGAMLLWEVSFMVRWDDIKRYFVEPKFNFKYYGFGWVEPLPEVEMNWLLLAMGLLSVGVIIGLHSRICAALFGVAFTYVFLLEKARYMNHFYLMILLCFLLSLTPCSGAFSIDALRHPWKRRKTVPAWTLWLLRFQFGVVYFYAGLAKLHPDWLAGRPMREMLSGRFEDSPALSAFVEQQWVVLLASYGALLFDLFLTPLLLWKRTRFFALAVAISFHALNSVIFIIDVFPWLMLGGTFILFFPDRLPLRAWLTRGEPETERESRPRQRRLTMAFLGVYTFLQVTIPLRHHLYSGDPSWTYKGHGFAWRMLNHTKVGLPPKFSVSFTLNGKRYEDVIPLPNDDRIWRKHWRWRVMLQDPDLIHQFVLIQAGNLRQQGAEDIEIRALVGVSLNGRYPQLIIDPDANLAAVPRGLLHQPWITTFDPGAEEDPRFARSLRSHETTGR